MCRKAATVGHQRHDPGAESPPVPAWLAAVARQYVHGRAVLMPWARIDDGFDDHPKVLALLDHDDGAAALGLWVLCLTWAHRNTRKKGKIPGRVPLSLPRRYLGVPGRDAAKLLVDAGLWDVAEDGWDIHDFDQYLPTAETSSARSAAGKKGAASRWGRQGEAAAPDSNEPSSDGNLPSGAMASDGNGMTADGSGMAPAGTGAATAPPGSGGHSTDGKLPSSDSNELSGDGKRMASDGSRAPARRAISKEIAPTPVPDPGPGVPPTAGAAPARRRLPPAEVAERQRHVGEVVAAFADGATDAGMRSPPAPLRARVGKQARALLGEDWPIDALIESARRMGAGEFNDLAVQVRKDEAAAKGVAASRAAADAGSTGAARARAAMEAGDRVQARIDNGGRL